MFPDRRIRGHSQSPPVCHAPVNTPQLTGQCRSLGHMLQIVAERPDASAPVEEFVDENVPFLFGERVYLPYTNGKTTACHSTSTTVEYTPDD